MKTHLRENPASPYGADELSAFTLIELLVVVAIIAVLVAGAFGAYGFVMERARRSEAQSMSLTIYNAIDQYHTEYDFMPTPMSATKGTDSESDTSAEEGLVYTLLGLDINQNRRKTNFLGDIKDAKYIGNAQSGRRRAGGVVRDAESAAIFDPWGSVYKVTLDLDLNGKIQNPNEIEAGNGKGELFKNAIVYSPGKDLNVKTWKDNASSWSSQ